MSARDTFQHPEMPALVLTCIGACVGYLLAYLGALPVLHYLPLERRWTLEPGGHLSMSYFGVLLDAALIAVFAFALGRWPRLARRLARPPWPVRLAFLACLLLIVTLLTVLFVELVHGSAAHAS